MQFCDLLYPEANSPAVSRRSPRHKHIGAKALVRCVQPHSLSSSHALFFSRTDRQSDPKPREFDRISVWT